jgi:hypothetical protein
MVGGLFGVVFSLVGLLGVFFPLFWVGVVFSLVGLVFPLLGLFFPLAGLFRPLRGWVSLCGVGGLVPFWIFVGVRG